MKKLWKPLVVALVVILVAMLLPPGVAFADAVTNVTDTLSTSALNTAATHTIKFCNPTKLFANDKIIVTFSAGWQMPADNPYITGYVILKNYLDKPVGVSSAEVTTATRIVTVTVNATLAACTGTQLSTLIINAGAGIKNPTTAGVYTVSVKTSEDTEGSDTVNIANPVPGTTEITANPALSITIDAPEAVTAWSLTLPSSTQEKSGAAGLEITSNTYWNVAVKDALDTSKAGATAGKMAEWTGSAYVSGGKVLTNALKIKGANQGYVTLSGTDQNLYTTDQAAGNYTGTNGITITFTQDLSLDDKILTGGNVYRIVVTFTASVKG